MAKPIRLSFDQLHLQQQWRMQIRALGRTLKYREIMENDKGEDGLAGKLMGQLRGNREFYPETLSAVSAKFGMENTASLVAAGKAYILSMLPHWPEDVRKSVVDAKWVTPQEAARLSRRDDMPAPPQPRRR